MTAPSPAGGRLPILCYHAVAADTGGPLAPWALSPERFDEHLDALTAAGYRGADLGAVVTAVHDEGRPVPDDVVVVTVDDGYADAAEAVWPRLAARGWPLTIYVTTGVVGGRFLDRPTLDRHQVADLASAGVTVGAHGHRHVALDVVDPGTAAAEVRASRELLEDWIQRPVTTFAYPHGHHDRAARDLVAGAGFHSACAVKQALSSAADDRFALARVMPSAGVTGPQLVHRLRAPSTPVARGQGERLRTRAHRALRRARARRRRVAVPA